MSTTKSNPADSSTTDKVCMALATKIIGDKWTPLLLFSLANKTCRFCELQGEVGGVNPRTLSARLVSLEEAGIVTRAVYPEVPPRVEYALSEKGRDFIPVLEGMVAWGTKYAA